MDAGTEAEGEGQAHPRHADAEGMALVPAAPMAQSLTESRHGAGHAAPSRCAGISVWSAMRSILARKSNLAATSGGLP